VNYLIIVLRLTHIFAGVFWVGGTLITSFFLRPTLEATGVAGQQIMQHLMAKTRLSTAMTAAGILTILAGYSMYWLDSDGFSSAWMHSGPGIGFAMGGAAGLLGLVFRILIGRKMAALSRVVSGISDQPTIEQTKKVSSLQKTLSILNPLNTWSLVIAVVFMAIARYLVF
jgi:uncharacterized membrane protein